MLIGGNDEWWARFHDELRSGRYDEEVVEFLRTRRPDLLEDLNVNAVVECWGEEKDELQDNALLKQVLDAALRAAPTVMLEFFGNADSARASWWNYEFEDQN